MRIKDILFQALAPRFKGVLWAKPEGDAVKLLINHNGEWKELAGGSGSGTSGSNAGCDCPYQVMIKGTIGDENFVYELVKGDYATARNKLENGEYVDFRCYGFLGDKMITVIIESAIVDESCIAIKIYDSESYLYWTADGIGMEASTDSGTDNPGTGGNSGDGGQTK